MHTLSRHRSLTSYIEKAYRGCMPDRIRMTRTTRDVLRVLLDGLRDELHGLEICRRAGLGSGTTYPILARLEQAGLVTAEWEDEEAWLYPADGKRRPRRRIYTLTGEGELIAREASAATATPLRSRRLGGAHT